MKLWLIEQSKYDWHTEVKTMVVRAPFESDVRNLAAAVCGAEGPEVWQDPELSTVVGLVAGGEPGVILQAMGAET